MGCGVVGQRRARHLAGARLIHCVDSVASRASQLAESAGGCASGTDWCDLIRRPDVDAVIIATPQDMQAVIARAAIEAGRHVLIEKPAARHVAELAELPGLAARHGVRVRVGFNHRFHPAFLKARELVDAGALGPLLYLRARYGHGGRVGYENEWRAEPHRSGGGELIDQGVHLIDLARWFLGDFVEVSGFVNTYFWDMPVEDNGFLLLKTRSRQAAFMHASWTEWKNTFSWELFGREGKLQVEGLGGSYGVETLTWFRMLPSMGPPEISTWRYAGPDDSWQVEMAAFIEDIERGRDPTPGLDDAIAALAVVAEIYREAGHDHHA